MSVSMVALYVFYVVYYMCHRVSGGMIVYGFICLFGVWHGIEPQHLARLYMYLCLSWSRFIVVAAAAVL